MDAFPFPTARAMHTNLLVLWMLPGFMGGTYYIVPEETKSEIYSPGLAWFRLIALLATGVTALVFLFNVGMTMLKAKNWTVGPDHIPGDILKIYPETEKVFRKYYGDGCFSCPGQATESVKQSALLHNVSEKQLLAELKRAAGI